MNERGVKFRKTNATMHVWFASIEFMRSLTHRRENALLGISHFIVFSICKHCVTYLSWDRRLQDTACKQKDKAYGESEKERREEKGSRNMQRSVEFSG